MTARSARNLQWRTVQAVGSRNRRDGKGEVGSDEVEQFMAVAAHDLRNPIAVVRASAQMAQRQFDRGDLDLARGRLKAIIQQTDRLADMLDTFVDAARIGVERLPLKPEPVDIRDVVQAALERARLVTPDQIERPVEVDIPEGLVGRWDRAHVGRAVRALLANAFVFGDPTQPVHVRGSRDEDTMRLRFTGSGRGPLREELAHLFERFYRGPSAAEAGAGSGLGLFTARGIARLHGGDVRWLDGDTFELALPM
jgi:two-component system, OmpR family, sensor histidine kinase KdpD